MVCQPNMKRKEKKNVSYIEINAEEAGTRSCDHSVVCSHPNPTAAPSAAYIVAQCRRLADQTYSGETRRAPLEAPTSVKLPNQAHWSHFGE